jgi:hypothetical protein
MEAERRLRPLTASSRIKQQSYVGSTARRALKGRVAVGWREKTIQAP